MKEKLIPIVLLLAILSGCGFIRDQKLNFEACMADIACKENAEAWKDRGETATAIIAAPLPLPGASAAPKVVGYISLLIAGLIGGHTLRKKKESESV